MSAPLPVKAKSRRLRFGLRTGLGGIAVLALFEAWFRSPYRAEKHAAAALVRLGGKIVMVDDAPRWLRPYVSRNLLDMSVAATVDLSHSRVTDADLPHLKAFRHSGLLNLSDTGVGDAGLVHLREVVAGRFIDLSRTRVTDTSALFGNTSLGHPLGLKLAGNRVARGSIFPSPKQWSPLQELDLSDTDADDWTLESFPEGLVNLWRLDLSGTAVGDAGLNSLLRLKNLTKLDLRDTRVTAEGVARLQSHWPGMRPLTVLTGSKTKAPKAPQTPSASTSK